MPNQVTHSFKQINYASDIKPSHHCRIFLLLFSYFLFLLFVSARLSCHCSPVLLHIYILLSVPLLSFLFISLSSFSSSLTPFFIVQGEILVSIIPPAPPLVTSSLGGWGSQRPFRPCREDLCSLTKKGEVKELRSWMYHENWIPCTKMAAILAKFLTQQIANSVLHSPLHIHISESFHVPLTLHRDDGTQTMRLFYALGKFYKH